MTTGLRTPNSELPAASLTKREHFAGLAMQGMNLKSDGQRSPHDLEYGIAKAEAHWVAAAAVRYADALIAELSK